MAMITGTYAHILDEDRKVNAQKFETAFYAKPDLRNVRPPEEQKTLQTPKKGLQRCFLASQRGFEPPTPRLGVWLTM